MRGALLGLILLAGCAAAPDHVIVSVTSTTSTTVVVQTTTTSTSEPVTTTTTARAPIPPGIWDRIAACESGGHWDDTRGGYEGGVHFLHSTWVDAGGRRYAEHAYQATREQQIEVATAWLKKTDWSQWPVCSYKVGAR